MAIPVAAFFEQSAWSTLRLLEVCEGLPDARLDEQVVAAFGSVRETLVHLAATEQRYITRLGGPAPAHPINEGDRPAFDTLKRAVQASSSALAQLATEAIPGLTVPGVTEYGLDFETDPAVFLLQVINHSAGHRMQVMVSLSTLGLGPPDLDEQIDAWSWGLATGRLRTE